MHKFHDTLETILRNNKTLRISNASFEEIYIRQNRNMMIVTFAIIIVSCFCHLLFALPSFFNDYDINLAYWFTQEYYGTPYGQIIQWLFNACLLIASFAIAYPMIFVGYLKHNICFQFRSIAYYVEYNFNIKSNHDTYIHNTEYQESVYTKLKTLVEYSLSIKRSLNSVLALQGYAILLLTTTGSIACVALLFFIIAGSISQQS
uniref:Uncharacterized protein LOC114342115 n=1 Tax=Diabrotica virgifera virgifera TaxID=50390 RepID=A0A6P7GTM1_DIAVI